MIINWLTEDGEPLLTESGIELITEDSAEDMATVDSAAQRASQRQKRFASMIQGR